MKIRLSFSGAQKLLAILSSLLAAGYFVYLAMAWSSLEERIVIYWRVPLSMHIEIAYRWYLLLPPILFLLESLLIWRLSSLRVSHDPPSLSDSIRMDGLQCVRTALCSMNVLLPGIFWLLTYYIVNREEISWGFPIFAVFVLVLWSVLCCLLCSRFLRRLRDGLAGAADLHEV